MTYNIDTAISVFVMVGKINIFYGKIALFFVEPDLHFIHFVSLLFPQCKPADVYFMGIKSLFPVFILMC